MRSVFKPIVLLLAAHLCLLAASAQNIAGDPDIIMMNGYTFERPKATTDTLEMEDPVTGEHIYKYVTRTYPPTTINGARIYKHAEVIVAPEPHSDGAFLEQYVLKGLVPLIGQLPDDTYALDIEHVVVSKTGKVVYYTCDGIRNCVAQHTTAASINDAAISKVKELMLTAPVFNTGSTGGEQVPYFSEAFTHTCVIKVKDRRWSFEKMKH